MERMVHKAFEFEAVLQGVLDVNGAYCLVVHHDVLGGSGKGGLAASGNEAGIGSAVGMGARDLDGLARCMIGVRKEIRAETRKGPGDRMRVVFGGRK